ncbi:undecaprenyl-phosphate glucose phosphotransferase, partial [candidate division TA06 bacterium]
FILQGVIGEKNGFYDEHIIGTLKNFDKIINEYNINTGIITLDKNKEEDILKLITKCRNNNISIYLISDFFDIVDNRNTKSLSGLPIINLTSDSGKNIYFAIKRIFDILISFFCIIMLSPLMILISYLIKLNSKGPVIFKQERVGKDGKPFVMYKFRSMFSDSRHITHKQYIEKFILEQNDDSVYKINGDPRITKIGRILRETSLDELPQLLNVLKGNMSIIGPRPAIGYEVSIYRDWHKKRLRVKPGITGFWQINGRSKVKFDDMVILDIYYIENWSLLLDFIILLKTIPVVIGKEGAY